MSDVRISNREIYDSVQELKLMVTTVQTEVAHLKDRAARTWHVWLCGPGPAGEPACGHLGGRTGRGLTHQAQPARIGTQANGPTTPNTTSTQSVVSTVILLRQRVGPPPEASGPRSQQRSSREQAGPTCP